MGVGGWGPTFCEDNVVVAAAGDAFDLKERKGEDLFGSERAPAALLQVGGETELTEAVGPPRKNCTVGGEGRRVHVAARNLNNVDVVERLDGRESESF